MNKITINDIARIAKCSKATVSLAIRNSPKVKQETKDRILKVVKKYNFYPNYIASKLASGKTGVIAVVASRFSNTFLSPLLTAIENYIFNKEKKIGEYKLQLYSTFNKIEIKNEILREILYSKVADAVVVITIKPEQDIISEYKKFKRPLILVENKDPNAHSITIDNEYGVECALDYLYNNNRKNIVFIVGSLTSAIDEEVSGIPEERLNAYKNWCKNKNITVDNKKIYYCRSYWINEAREVADKIIKENKYVDAIFCAAGDIFANGIMQRLIEKGIKIPDDIAIIGYDNHFIGEAVTPQLSTVDQKLEEVGVQAYLLAVDAINEKIKSYKSIIIKPELIKRQSSSIKSQQQF
jgi:LacI family transcriptional regulator